MTEYYTTGSDGIEYLVDTEKGTRTPVDPLQKTDSVWLGGVEVTSQSAEAHHANENQWYSDTSAYAPAATAPIYETLTPHVGQTDDNVGPAVPTIEVASENTFTDEFLEFGGSTITYDQPDRYTDEFLEFGGATIVYDEPPIDTGYYQSDVLEQPWESETFDGDSGFYSEVPTMGTPDELDPSAWGAVVDPSSPTWGYGPNETLEELSKRNEWHDELQGGEGGNSFFERFVDPIVPGDQDSWSDFSVHDELYDAGTAVTTWGGNVAESVQDDGLVDGLGINPGNIFGNIGTALVPLLLFSMIGDED